MLLVVFFDVVNADVKWVDTNWKDHLWNSCSNQRASMGNPMCSTCECNARNFGNRNVSKRLVFNALFVDPWFNSANIVSNTLHWKSGAIKRFIFRHRLHGRVQHMTLTLKMTHWPDWCIINPLGEKLQEQGGQLAAPSTPLKTKQPKAKLDLSFEIFYDTTGNESKPQKTNHIWIRANLGPKTLQQLTLLKARQQILSSNLLQSESDCSKWCLRFVGGHSVFTKQPAEKITNFW